MLPTLHRLTHGGVAQERATPVQLQHGSAIDAGTKRPLNRGDFEVVQDALTFDAVRAQLLERPVLRIVLDDPTKATELVADLHMDQSLLTTLLNWSTSPDKPSINHTWRVVLPWLVVKLFYAYKYAERESDYRKPIASDQVTVAMNSCADLDRNPPNPPNPLAMGVSDLVFGNRNFQYSMNELRDARTDHTHRLYKLSEYMGDVHYPTFDDSDESMMQMALIARRVDAMHVVSLDAVHANRPILIGQLFMKNRLFGYETALQFPKESLMYAEWHAVVYKPFLDLLTREVQALCRADAHNTSENGFTWTMQHKRVSQVYDVSEHSALPIAQLTVVLVPQ